MTHSGSSTAVFPGASPERKTENPQSSKPDRDETHTKRPRFSWGAVASRQSKQDREKPCGNSPAHIVGVNPEIRNSTYSDFLHSFRDSRTGSKSARRLLGGSVQLLREGPEQVRQPRHQHERIGRNRSRQRTRADRVQPRLRRWSDSATPCRDTAVWLTPTAPAGPSRTRNADAVTIPTSGTPRRHANHHAAISARAKSAPHEYGSA